MKPYKTLITIFCASTLMLAMPMCAQAAQATKVAVVNFKECVEHSKLGVEEQKAFNKMKQEAEDSLKGKEEELTTLANKLNDSDYMDSLTSNAEKDLKEQYRTLSQDLARKQQAAYQNLTQTNYQIAQKLQEEVTKASDKVAKREGFDLILNQDACFYCSTTYNITSKVVEEMDSSYNN